MPKTRAGSRRRRNVQPYKPKRVVKRKGKGILADAAKIAAAYGAYKGASSAYKGAKYYINKGVDYVKSTAKTYLNPNARKNKINTMQANLNKQLEENKSNPKILQAEQKAKIVDYKDKKLKDAYNDQMERYLKPTGESLESLAKKVGANPRGLEGVISPELFKHIGQMTPQYNKYANLDIKQNPDAAYQQLLDKRSYNNRLAKIPRQNGFIQNLFKK